jgi:serine/tyrosine/threonine adenylyltransferase
MINFKNTYAKLPDKFFERVLPAKFDNPKLIHFNNELATELEINFQDISEEELTQIFSGQNILDGSEPMALAYAAHQFGNFVPQLGDGRAHLLGEVNGNDIQLKGSGQTRFSRNGDGRSGLGPVIREYLLSEAMHYLHVPTTRALCAVTTGEQVIRQCQEPGGVFTRVAPSHVRVGTFQYFTVREDVEGLRTLMDYTINRHYSKLNSIKDETEKALAFITSVGEAQAKLISKWMALGFIHGVMNTDNYTVGGFTIDFGPCAFMDEFKFDKVFSSIDRNGRYAYQNQLAIGQWNLMRLADCLLPIIDQDEKEAISKVEKIIPGIVEQFNEEHFKAMANKFGFVDPQESDKDIIGLFLGYLQEHGCDFTQSFRNLTSLFNGDSSTYPKDPKLDAFVKLWKERVTDVSSLNLVNPFIIPRNHQVERAIQEANEGDYSLFKLFLEAIKNPFVQDEQYGEFYKAPTEEQKVKRTFCGT